MPRRRALLALTLCGAVALASCAATSGARTTPTLGAPQPTKIAAEPGDTSLCAVISPAEFTRVSGETATQVTPGATRDSLTGLQEVYCIYADASDPQQLIGRGTINFEIAADARTAASTFQKVRQSFTAVVAVSGVGDAAFAGTPGGTGAGTGLIVVSGTLLLYLSVDGDTQAVVRITRQLAALVLSRVVGAGAGPTPTSG